jgi:hypothetical protein
VSLSFVRVIVSVSPTGTFTVSGLNRIPVIATATVVVWPVAAGEAAVLPPTTPSAAGSIATPMVTASSRTPTAERTAPVRRGGNTASGGAADSRGGGCGADCRMLAVAGRTRRLTRIARVMKTRNDASAERTTSDTATLTKLVTGRR